MTMNIINIRIYDKYARIIRTNDLCFGGDYRHPRSSVGNISSLRKLFAFRTMILVMYTNFYKNSSKR